MKQIYQKNNKDYCDFSSDFTLPDPDDWAKQF